MNSAPSTARQTDLFGEPAPQGPEGFRYAADLISVPEERDLLAQFHDLPFQPFAFHGFLGARRVVAFGWRYDFSAARLQTASPLPPFLVAIRRRIAAFAGRPEDDFPQAMVTEYAAGAGIGWHRDKPQFGDVVGVSLGAPCTLRFRLKAGGAWRRMKLAALPRSAYLLRGPARDLWEHSIPPVQALRYSITFRTFRTPPPAAP